MADILTEPFAGAGLWRGDEIKHNSAWIHRLDGEEVAEIDAALLHAKRSGVGLFDMGAEHFPLGAFGKRLAAVRSELEGGRGFQLLRGIPVGRYSPEECRLVAWGLASHVGSPEPQDRKGSLMHDITDTGKTVEGSDATRGFETNEELTFHNDGGDAFMLLCLKTARSGGVSKLASAGALFNEVMARRPDLAEALQRPFFFDARSQEGSGRSRCQVVPVFIHHAGHLSALYKRRYIDLAQRFPEVPRLTREQVEALDLVDAICADPEFHLSFEMEPGDVQMGNNYAVLHSRTQFEDHDDPRRKRHLLRIWMTLPNGRPLPRVFGDTREFGPAYARRMAGELATA